MSVAVYLQDNVVDDVVHSRRGRKKL
jgi:hypothetical protein